MKTYTFEAGALAPGITQDEDWRLTLGSQRVSVCRHRPARGHGHTVTSADLKRVVPHERNGRRPPAFWVLAAPYYPNDTRVMVLLRCKAWEPVSGDSVVLLEGSSTQGRDALVQLAGVIKVTSRNGEVFYLALEGRESIPKCLTETSFAARDRKRRAAQELREQAAAERERLREEERRRWTAKEETVTKVVSEFSFHHDSGVKFYKGGYWHTNTFISVRVPGDPKGWRQISVDGFVRKRTGWKLITARREEALQQALPERFTVHGDASWEERDSGERRYERVWYRLDRGELAAWVDRAVASLGSE